MLEEENTCCTFNLEDISDSEDIWIMDLPRSVSYSDEIYNCTIFLNILRYQKYNLISA